MFGLVYYFVVVVIGVGVGDVVVDCIECYLGCIEVGDVGVE